ncbi:hypothetical protein Tco_0895002 [Tanacetum coccineum]|uniref:Uncharacterized protein n=1 Tax=Tanacetum coccineum TaxID=301880 RepID=A0ABQ5CDD3_9ASTR
MSCSEISTQADGAQSPRVPVTLPEDPYEAIRQAYLVETNTESEPFEDLEIETPESPHTVASPTSLPDSTPPTCHVEESEGSDTSGARSTSSDSTAPLSLDHPLTHTTPALVPSLLRTARMAVRVLPAMSPSLSASIAEVAAMSDSAFRKRFRPSYDSSPSSSPPDLPSRKRYRAVSISTFFLLFFCFPVPQNHKEVKGGLSGHFPSFYPLDPSYAKLASTWLEHTVFVDLLEVLVHFLNAFAYRVDPLSPACAFLDGLSLHVGRLKMVDQ